MATTREFQNIHSIYRTILEQELRHSVPLPSTVQEILEGNGAAARPQVADEWLALLDRAVAPHLMRNYIKERAVEDETLCALVRFLIGKKHHTQEDRDKVDWLATHLFQQREQRQGTPTSWPRADLDVILAGYSFSVLSARSEDLLMEVPALLDETKYFEHFSQITDSRIIQRARDLKHQFSTDFFHPDVLAPIINYNLVFGRKFHKLLGEAMQRVHDFARAHTDSLPPTTEQIMSSDYRQATEALRHLGEMGRKDSVASPTPAGQEPSPEQDLKRMGVDLDQEALYLRNRAEELTMRLRSTPAMDSIPNAFAPLLLNEWEAGAFRSVLPESEQSFRADFARSVSRAITLVYRIYEEIPAYFEKKGTEYLWKRHYDSLLYLLYEGRNQREILIHLAVAAEKRGLRDKTKQLQATIQKLDAALAKVAELF